MSGNHWTELPIDDKVTQPAIQAQQSRTRLWAERVVIGLVASISLLLPILFGLLFYLAITDGLVINAEDPLHEVRLWMIQEKQGATGLGLTFVSRVSDYRGVQCVRTNVTFLKWDHSLRLETDGDYCRCYELRDGQLYEVNTPCP